MDVGLAYRDSTLSEWTEMAHSIEHRKLSCNFTATKVNTLVISDPDPNTPLTGSVVKSSLQATRLWLVVGRFYSQIVKMNLACID